MTIHRTASGRTCQSIEEHLRLELATRDGHIAPVRFAAFIDRDFGIERRLADAPLADPTAPRREWTESEQRFAAGDR